MTQVKGQYLTGVEREEIRLLLKQEQWKRLRTECLETWKDCCAEKIVRSSDKEGMDFASLELRHGTRTMLWFFNQFIGEVAKELDTKIEDDIE